MFLINVLKIVISKIFDMWGFTILRKGSLKTLMGNIYPITSAMIPRGERAFAHQRTKGNPNVNLETYDLKPTEEDFQIARRLLISYRKAVTEQKELNIPIKSDLWKILGQSKHKDFIEIIEQGDSERLGEYLCNMCKHSVTHGMTQGLEAYEKIVGDVDIKKQNAAYFMDKLVSLGEALGVLPREYPEAGRWGENLYVDIDLLIDRIEEYIGIDIIPPRVSGGLYGIVSKKGLLHFRDINSIYTAWRIWELVKNNLNPSICEIGGGTGRVAYYCFKLGLRNYTIVDLPYVCILSGYYLIKSLPKGNVTLFGENLEDFSNSIKIYPYWSFNGFSENSFDLTLNQDSFPEIHQEIVLAYLREIRKNTKQYFLSINQEGQAPQTGPENLQLIVPNLIKDNMENGFERVYRFAYWMREGYIEELYKILK